MPLSKTGMAIVQRLLTRRARSSLENTPSPCMDCGYRKAVMINTELVFDFDPSALPKDLQPKFVTRKDGLCFNCGLYQDYLRYDFEELRRFATFNKDATASEGAFHAYPVPESFIETFDDQYSRQRLLRWDDFFASCDAAPRRCLFLRPMFGAGARHIAETFDASVHALEISKACELTARDRVPGITFLNGQIHGMLDGEFLHAGPFDAIFVFHTLIHCVDVHQALRALKGLLSQQGFLLLSQEVQIKPHNPFHLLFPTEHQLLRLLSQHFRAIDRIDDCEPAPPPFITQYSLKSDSPDFVAWP